MRNSHRSWRNICLSDALWFDGWSFVFINLHTSIQISFCYLGCSGGKKRCRLSMYEGNARSSALVSLKIITPSAYQSWERGGIIYRDINSLRQSIEFYNLSVIGCIVPSAKSTEFHVIKIKKESKNMLLTTILEAIIFVSWHLYWPSRGRQAVSCAIIIIIIGIIINAASPFFQYG